MSDYFKNALKDFASDFAYGDSVRHLAKKGLAVRQISSTLTYPATIDQIKDIVWKYYIEAGIIRLEMPPENSSSIIKTNYVLERDKYGHSSYRKVDEIVPIDPKEYVACDFGKLLYSNKDSFIKSLEGLDIDDINYILDLPWPLTSVYHIKDERITRIMKQLLSQHHEPV